MRAGGKRRALTIGVGEVTSSGVAGALEPLPFAPRLARDVANVLQDLGFEIETLDTGSLPSHELGREVWKRLDAGGAADVLLVHVVAHGYDPADESTLYALGSDGSLHRDADIGRWLTMQQHDQNRPLTLFLLDLCSAGAAARQRWQQLIEGEASRSWVIAATGRRDAAYDGRFSQALLNVLRALRDKNLDIETSSPFAPLSTVARAVSREVNLLAADTDGYSQQVTASMVDISAEEEDLAFFPNPGFRQASAIEPVRSAVEPGLLPFLLDLDEGLDPLHYVERAAGIGQHRDHLEGVTGCFTGRVREVRRLSMWLNAVQDGSLGDGPLAVLTGSPGAGKSALLGVLVCAAHPGLRAPTRRIWNQLQQVPHPMPHLVAVHARQRSTSAVIASVARQLRMPGESPLAALIEELTNRTGPVPVIVLDALDESDDGPGLLSEFLAPLIAAGRTDGRPAARLLVGTRDYREYASLMEQARVSSTLVDLDDVAPGVLEDDIFGYVSKLMRSTPVYRQGRPGVTGAFAEGVARTLTKFETGSNGNHWGPFLVAGLYTQHVIATSASAVMETAAEADVRGQQVPLDLPSLLDLDLQSASRPPLLRAVMLALAHARGDGMPLSLLTRVTGIFAGDAHQPGPSLAEVRAALTAGKVYLRQSADSGRTAVYRLFHQGLVDHLRLPSVDRENSLLEALLAPLGPAGARNWDAAEPYVVQHAIEHAIAGDALDKILIDPGFVFNTALGDLPFSGAQIDSRTLRLIASLRQAEHIPDTATLALQAARAGLTEIARRVANLPGATPLTWQPIWVHGSDDAELAPPQPNAGPAEGQETSSVTPDQTAKTAQPIVRRIALQRKWPISCVSISANGLWAASADERSVKLLEIGQDGDVQRESEHGTGAVALHISAIGREVAWINSLGTLTMFDGKRMFTQSNTGLAGRRLDIAIAPGGRGVVAMVDSGAGSLVWNPIANTIKRMRLPMVRSILAPSTRRGETPIVMPLPTVPAGSTSCATAGGTMVAVGSPDGTVSLMAADGERIALSPANAGRVSAIATSAAGDFVVSGNEDGQIIVWHVKDQTARTVSAELDGHVGTVTSVAITNAGDRVISGGADGTVILWDLGRPVETAPDQPTKAPVLSVLPHPKLPTAITLAPMTVPWMAKPSQVIVIANTAGGILIREVQTGQLVVEMTEVIHGPVDAICIQIVDGETLLRLRSQVGCLQLHLTSGRRTSVAQNDETFDGLVWGSQVLYLNGRLVEPVLQDSTLVVRDVMSGRRFRAFRDRQGVRDLGGPATCVTAGRLSGNPVAVTGGEDGRVQVWDLTRPRLPPEVIQVHNPIWAIAIGDENQLLIGAGAEVLGFRRNPSGSAS